MEKDDFFMALNDVIVEDARDMKVQVDTTINEVDQLDVLLISEGFKETLLLIKDETLLNGIKGKDNTFIRINVSGYFEKNNSLVKKLNIYLIA
ncbi:hypothetical protein [Winogradskyella psychrotolerans]|uniref:hypothetical protein n=1 Tax=Winogradskyella psychrotolerans TaxID=1344585 RepID=UPI001C064E46|nr:hypothetical protein [Winogradskyella psychrotolerans]MBU2926686.1 hypothetical protein [Winogradskyella psychrotolerans]